MHQHDVKPINTHRLLNESESVNIVCGRVAWVAWIPSLVAATTHWGGFLIWNDCVRPTVTLESPLSNRWPPSCILDMSLETSVSEKRSCWTLGLGSMTWRWGGTRDGGTEVGMEGGAIVGGANFTLWGGTGLTLVTSTPESEPLCAAPLCSGPIRDV